MPMHVRPLLLAALLVALGPARPARAEPDAASPAAAPGAPPEAASPAAAPDAGAEPGGPVDAAPLELAGGPSAWSVSVSQEDRRAAEALFQQGNALMRDSLCIAAAARYREALQHWDHPNIHYNLSIALMTLDQPIETHHHLKQAVRYGPEPLQQERFEHANNYLKLLEKQVAEVDIRCDVPGATVELDGKTLFIAPGQHRGEVLAGPHTVVASKPGLVTNHSVRTFPGGQTTTVELQLQAMSDLTEIHRRFPKYLPWTLIGVGAVVAGAGGGMQYLAVKKNDEVDSESRRLCPRGCAAGEPATLASKRKDAEKLQRLAVAAYAVGGAAIVAGGVLAYFNRTEVRVRSYDGPAQPAEPPRASLEVRPMLAPEGGGVVLSLAF